MAVLTRLDGVRVGGAPIKVFYCPGCRGSHWLDDRWTWNGDMERPTFTPSLLVAPDDSALRCHSFVTDGMIHYLEDSHHRLAGQTVPIPDWDEDQ
jgi:hypothetical protein